MKTFPCFFFFSQLDDISKMISHRKIVAFLPSASLNENWNLCYSCHCDVLQCECLVSRDKARLKHKASSLAFANQLNASNAETNKIFDYCYCYYYYYGLFCYNHNHNHNHRPFLLIFFYNWEIVFRSDFFITIIFFMETDFMKKGNATWIIIYISRHRPRLHFWSDRF